MSHHHHDNNHHHHHESNTQLSFEDKMVTLTEHWKNHNLDHAVSYREWAEKAKENNMSAISAILEQVADMTLEINKKFEQAASLIKKG